MSLHYEVVFSVFLRDDTPALVMDELRWHLGLSMDRPSHLVVDYGEQQVLRPYAPSHLPGGETALLQRQLRHITKSGEHHAWGLFCRLYWLDDQWAEVWWQLAVLVATWADEDGYIGFFRERTKESPTAFLAKNGELVLIDGERD